MTPNQSEIINLFESPLKDDYVAILDVQNGPVRVWMLDPRDVKNNTPNPTVLFDKYVSAKTTLKLPHVTEAAILVLTNASPRTLSGDILIFRTGTRSKLQTDPIKKWVESVTTPLNQSFNFPDFTINVQPCGFINAYSSPDVTVCSELISSLDNQSLSAALTPILLHELAHSLLFLWKIPGYNNEDIADEFATVLLSGEPRVLNTFIKWLENSDSVTEAILQLVNGDRHTISIQRARNIRDAMSNPSDLVQRWEKMLAPYSRIPIRSN